MTNGPKGLERKRRNKMGSPSFLAKYGKYVGNASATLRAIECGFKPKVVKIYSLAGEVVLQEGMPGAWKQVDSGIPTTLSAAALKFSETGFEIASTDAALNGSSTDHWFEAY